MKKTLSLFLAVLMLSTALIVPASAGIFAPDIREPGVCVCEDHIKTGPCHCCIYCENLDNTYVLDCCKKDVVGGEEVWTFCCAVCNGLWDCECVDCDCCSEKKDEQLNEGSNAIIPPSAQNSIVSGFQNAMRKIKEVFDNIFNTIFEFLRIDEFFGN